ncbi:MAG: ABC transporter substrate-binding protein [Synergistaceae bacterium]|jgi:NitT/TauT family transport system substrate-binding protein|nr:ABC transporter substrate-binding protein [Synergistaceae bacterium]
MKRIKSFCALLAVSAICAVLLAAFAHVSPAASAPAPFRLVVADANTTHHLNLYVAKELGIFDKYGLDVVIESVADNAAARDLVVSGTADVFWSCPTVAIAAIANGTPFKSIAQVKRPCTSVLVVEQDSPIVSFADLNGKEIAGISPTCEAVISLAVKAKDAGGSFSLQRLAGGPAIAALESKSVDGAILEEPHVSIAELAGYKVVFPDVSANIPCRTINASDRVIASSGDQLKLFIRAVDEANARILANPTADDIVEIASAYTGAPKEAIVYGNDRLKFTITLDRDGLRKLGDELVKLGSIKENPGERLFAEAFRGITW